MKSRFVIFCFIIPALFSCASKNHFSSDRLPSSVNEAENLIDINGLGRYFIKVSERRDKSSVRYQLCQTANPNECHSIGNNLYYSKKQIMNFRNTEKKEVSGATDAIKEAKEIISYSPSFGVSAIFISGTTAHTTTYVQRANKISDDILSKKPFSIKEDILTVTSNIREILTDFEETK